METEFSSPEAAGTTTGVNSLTLGPSVAQREATLNNLLLNASGPVEVFGYSQSSTIASLEMSQLYNKDPNAPVSFILVGYPSNPDAGFLEPFVGGSIPSFG